ncbi:LOW QUALITY PROTEIN: vomeronasal type-2 receptor 1-like [Rhinatrema bivittatum]|uniref:LOW QUALITY PROTEIN: vomeronasal type-2 receptor 1-like n=1 Tax=Rhinatrema bivittatum TaxID=194408 RepID=UPI001127ED52|nr:LOW QUALITY PROTEIN: vomeronasal type-2 receptor 1-like [Rhinatrema bivittatum]
MAGLRAPPQTFPFHHKVLQIVSKEWELPEASLRVNRAMEKLYPLPKDSLELLKTPAGKLLFGDELDQLIKDLGDNKVYKLPEDKPRQPRAFGTGSLQTSCILKSWSMDAFSRAGDIIIGGMFVVHSEYTSPELPFTEMPKPISCQGFHIRYYRDVLAMIFAIEEINKTPELLPNITLGFRIFDSCMSEMRAIWGILALLSGKQSPVPAYSCQTHPLLAGIIGEVMSSLSLPMARILGIFNYPQISYGSVLSTLSDKHQFPSFLRTIPRDKFQNVALPRLIAHFGWTWIGMIISDDDIGEQGRQDLKDGIEKNGGCVVFIEKIHLRYAKKKILRVVEVIQASSVNVVLIQSPEVHVKVLLEVLDEQNVTGKVFVFCVAFLITPGLFPKETWKLLNGTIGISFSTGLMPGFTEFLYNLDPSDYLEDIFIRLFWEKAFSCRWQNINGTSGKHLEATVQFCSGHEMKDTLDLSLFELFDLTSTYHSYLAVYAFAHTLNELVSCRPGHGPFSNGTCASTDDIQPWQTPEPTNLDTEHGIEYEVDDILDVHKRGKMWEYLISWDGYGPEENSLEPLANITDKDMVLHYLKNINFTTKTGENIFFDENGDVPAFFNVTNLQISHNYTFKLVKVGNFDLWAPRGKEVRINMSSIMWNSRDSQVPRSVCSKSCLPGYRKAARKGEPPCCFDCIPCSMGEISNDIDMTDCMKCPTDEWSNEKRDQCIPKVIEFLSFDQPLGLTLTLLSAFCSLLTAFVLCIFIKHRDTAIVKANNRGLSYLLLLALILCFLCSLIFIGRPRKLTCMLRQTVFGIIFSISVSSVLAKTVIVVIAFKGNRPNNPVRKWLGVHDTKLHYLFLFIGPKLLYAPPWLLLSPPFPELSTEFNNEKIIFGCNEGQNFFFLLHAGVHGLLATVSFIVAFLARNLPGSFNEAKHSSRLVCFVFVSVWLSFIPAYLSTHGKYMVAVEIFAILCSSAGLLACIFFPKCYIILLRPDRNTKEYLRPKTSTGSPQMSCILKSWSMDAFSRAGDIIIGGTFVVHSEYTSPELPFTEMPKPISCQGYFLFEKKAIIGGEENQKRGSELMPSSSP